MRDAQLHLNVACLYYITRDPMPPIKDSSSRSNSNSNYTDKRTGIAYANVCANDANQTSDLKMQPHLDAFIPPAFLKTYFADDGKGKSKS